MENSAFSMLQIVIILSNISKVSGTDSNFSSCVRFLLHLTDNSKSGGIILRQDSTS